MTLDALSFFQNFHVDTHNQPVIVPNPVYHTTLTTPNDALVSIPNIRFQNILNGIVQNAQCPVSPAPITVVNNPQNVTVITPQLTYPNYALGNYYKIPLNPTLSADGKKVPKYYASIPQPYFGFIYPANDVNTGFVLVKTTTPIFPVPNDVVIFNETETLSELQRIVATIFAF